MPYLNKSTSVVQRTDFLGKENLSCGKLLLSDGAWFVCKLTLRDDAFMQKRPSISIQSICIYLLNKWGQLENCLKIQKALFVRPSESLTKNAFQVLPLALWGGQFSATSKMFKNVGSYIKITDAKFMQDCSEHVKTYLFTLGPGTFMQKERKLLNTVLYDAQVETYHL